MNKVVEIEYLDLEKNKEYEEVIKKVLEKCFYVEKMQNFKVYISITLTNPENIRNLNKKYRNIDKSTDVLSFPMFEKSELDKKIKNKDFLYEDILDWHIIKKSIDARNKDNIHYLYNIAISFKSEKKYSKFDDIFS